MDGPRGRRRCVLSHEPVGLVLAKVQSRLVAVMPPASQFDIPHSRLAAHGVGPDVMELQETSFCAAVAIRSYECAPAEVAQPDLTLDLGGNPACSGRHPGRGPRPIGRGELLLRQRSQERGEGPVKYSRVVPRGDRVAQQVLGQLQLLESIAGNRELELVAIGRKGHYRGWGRPQGQRRSGQRLPDWHRDIVRNRRRQRLLRDRELANGSGRIGPGGEPGDDRFDFRPSLPASRLENRAVVVRREMRSQQPDGCEADIALGEQFEDHRESPGGSGHLDAVVGFALGERQRVTAVHEEGAITCPQVHVASVELGEMGYELSRRIAFPRGQAPYLRDELCVRETTERSEDVVRHVCLYHAIRRVSVAARKGAVRGVQEDRAASLDLARPNVWLAIPARHGGILEAPAARRRRSAKRLSSRIVGML